MHIVSPCLCLSHCLSLASPVYGSSYLLIPVLWSDYITVLALLIPPLHLCVLDFHHFLPAAPSLAWHLEPFFIWQLQAFLLREEEVFMSSRISLPAVPVWGHARGLAVVGCVSLPATVLIRIAAPLLNKFTRDFIIYAMSCWLTRSLSFFSNFDLWDGFLEKDPMTPQQSDSCPWFFMTRSSFTAPQN